MKKKVNLEEGKKFIVRSGKIEPTKYDYALGDRYYVGGLVELVELKCVKVENTAEGVLHYFR